MHLKRKRSESELSFSSASTASTFSSPSRIHCIATVTESTEPFSFGSPAFPVSPISSYNHRVSGRTMKRTRDNRPSEDEVHQRTLDKLYAGQRQQQHPPFSSSLLSHSNSQTLATSVTPSLPSPPPTTTITTDQPSLHSFWNLPSERPFPPTSVAAVLPTPLLDTPSECEDCGQGLAGDDDGDMMMDVDILGGTVSTACTDCGKHVCSHCSINSLGELRWCLGCAGTVNRGRTMARIGASTGGGGFGRLAWGRRGLGVWSC
ncbi:hypothetical protein F5Y16DRAFT_392163 [Xylariaceae sp. FL0255]|nr:hypothetical protein F5Y16DRAFT_392163 [Xylariaceae sp. FL0255]